MAGCHYLDAEPADDRAVSDTVTTGGGWDSGTASSTMAPQYLASCGHVHDWGIGCSWMPTPTPPDPTRFDRKFGPCSKCYGSDLLVQFHDGKSHCANCRKEGLPPPACNRSAECGEKGRRRAHLRVHCRRCQYGWLERPGFSA